ncbi:MAG TPA: bifunctional tetrahydrofolate synthase/dihydrofolate synthase [Rhodocyclaceae bacterium]|nr:bifunctional tetrahydrofolate synthase/dihydrofolate synthase [Rhodocyclaceae bacterium]
MSPAAPATLNDWLAYIEQQHTQAIELGLDRLFVVKAALGQTQTCPVIIVGGTNGKGSTCAMLEATLTAAGYRVGLYTSPHLLHYNERVRINGKPVSDEVLCAAFAKVEEARGDVPLTYFEFGTLGAWEVFAAAGLDAIILEVGLGGRLDAVNIYAPDCAIVTGIDLDHMDFLGDTREKIGFEKAGIFRTGKPAICGDFHAPHTLLEHAEVIGADLQLIGRDFGYQTQTETRQWSWWGRNAAKRGGLAYPALRGNRQLGNASVVFAALDTLQDRLPLSMAEIRQGLAAVELPGRFQTLPGRPVTVLDVAHNPQAARVLADNLLDQGFFGTTWAVCGMLRDKDMAGVVAALTGRIERWLPCTLGGPRGATSSELAQCLQAAGETVEAEFDTVMAAYAHAKEMAAENDRIVVFGSFLTVADVLDSRTPHGPDRLKGSKGS